MDTFFRDVNFYITIPESWHVFDRPTISNGSPHGTIKGFSVAHGGGNPQLTYQISGAENFSSELARLASDEAREMWVEEINGVSFHMWRRGDPNVNHLTIGALIENIPNAPADSTAMIRFSTAGNFNGFPPDELYAAIRSIEFAPPAEPLPAPEPKYIPDESWRSPTFRFEGERDPGVPFFVKTPDRSGMLVRQGIDTISGSIGTRGVSIMFEKGLIGSPEPVGEHVVPNSGVPARKFWKDIYFGQVTYFWHDVDFNGSLPTGGGSVGAYITRTGSPIRLYSNVNTPEELELVLAVIRTIR